MTLPRPKVELGSFGYAALRRPASIMLAPTALSLSHSREEFLGLIYSFQWHMFATTRQERANSPRTLLVDLRDVTSISLDAALVLTAEYHRRLLLSPKFYKPLIDDRGWRPEIRSLLSDLGFYELVEAVGRTSDEVEWEKVQSDLKFVTFSSGKKVDRAAARKLIDALGAAAGQQPARAYIYNALVEAIINVKHHAYLGDHDPSEIPSVSRWWAAGAYDPVNNMLQFAVYDQGVGIPATLPKRKFWTSIQRLLPLEFNDADLIAGGIRYSRSRFLTDNRRGTGDDDGRGNGLWSICNFLSELEGSSVRIVSGRGEVTYAGGRRTTKKHHANPFCGTLIQWNLKLPEEPNSEGRGE